MENKTATKSPAGVGADFARNCLICMQTQIHTGTGTNTRLRQDAFFFLFFFCAVVRVSEPAVGQSTRNRTEGVSCLWMTAWLYSLGRCTLYGIHINLTGLTRCSRPFGSLFSGPAYSIHTYTVCMPAGYALERSSAVVCFCFGGSCMADVCLHGAMAVGSRLAGVLGFGPPPDEIARCRCIDYG